MNTAPANPGTRRGVEVPLVLMDLRGLETLTATLPV